MDIDMTLDRLLKIAARLRDVPAVMQASAAIARDISALIEAIRANHHRARVVLADGEADELDAIHEETLAMIDAFDAELAKAAGGEASR